MRATLYDGSPEPFAEEVFSGTGPAATRLRLQVARLAPHFRAVLLVGEAGVGKATVARELHRMGPAASCAFTEIDVREFAAGASPAHEDGLFYLRGLEGLPLVCQADFLERFRKVSRDVRIVVGCECDPRGLVAAGRLRSEVFARIGTLEIRVAPLRERADEVDRMAAAMLLRQGSDTTLPEATLQHMLRYEWPGNLRELWRICGEIARGGGAESLRFAEPAALEGTWRLEAVMQRHVMDVLQRCAGNKLKAAELLGISRSTLYRMLDSAVL